MRNIDDKIKKINITNVSLTKTRNRKILYVISTDSAIEIFRECDQGRAGEVRQ